MYNKQESTVKQEIREVLLKHLDKQGKSPKRCLTLANTNFWLEENIIKKYPGSKCTSVEYDEEVYKCQKKVLKESLYRGDIKLTNGNVFDYNFRGIYDFLFIDLCGGYTINNINGILEIATKANFNKNAIFAFTLCTQRQDSGANLYGQFYKDYKNKGVIKHLGQFLDIKEAYVISYHCSDLSSKAAQMKLFICKVNGRTDVFREEGLADQAEEYRIGNNQTQGEEGKGESGQASA